MGTVCGSSGGSLCNNSTTLPSRSDADVEEFSDMENEQIRRECLAQIEALKQKLAE